MPAKCLNGKMVKTTINLRDDIYKKLVREAVEKYGNTKNLSRLINEKLQNVESTTSSSESDEIKRRLEIVRKTAGLWKIKETGKSYVKRLRKESEKRFKRLDI